MKKNIYFLNQDLGVKHTGIESSALLRSALFKNQLGMIPSFVTCKYRSQLGTEIQALKRKKKLVEEVVVINLYDFFQQLNDTEQEILSLYDGEFEVSFTGNSYQKYLDKNGHVKASVVYNASNQRLHYIVHFYQGKKWRRDYYHEGGSLSCTHLLDQDGQKVVQEIFYRTDRTICLIKHHFYQGDGARISSRIQVLDSQGHVIEVMDHDKNLIAYFLKKLLEDKQETSILLVDKNRFFYEPAMNVKKYYVDKRIQVIAAIHNLHAVNYHQKETSRININYVSVFKDLSQPDAVIVQTDIQKNDIIERFGDTRNVYAIPHTYEHHFQGTDIITRNPLKAVYFARYNHDKKHELAIEAFAKVVLKLPQAEFHCYGTGSRLTELQALVQQLGMANNIFLHGWCENVAAQYESAALSIISSESESFSLTIAESLAHGCPVVGFDVPYGPKALIENGENGYLVPFNDTQAMATKVIEIMMNAQLQIALSTHARNSALRYSEVVVKALWQQVFSEMDQRSYDSTPL